MGRRFVKFIYRFKKKKIKGKESDYTYNKDNKDNK